MGLVTQRRSLVFDLSMDSRRLDWKLARVTGSNMVEIRDVTVSSERHFRLKRAAVLRSKVTKLWNIEDFVYEWDENDFTELLERLVVSGIF